MDYNDLSEEAKSTVKEMVEFCINHGYRMGMDEGFAPDGTKQKFREEIEFFSGIKGN